jgi:hypothetical protein
MDESRPVGQPIEITRAELSALRVLAGKADNGAMVGRLLALALVLESRCQDAAALLTG